MKNLKALGAAALLCTSGMFTHSAMADDVSRDEFDALKARMQTLESTLQTQNATIAQQQQVIAEQASRLDAAPTTGGSERLGAAASWIDGVDVAFGATGVVQGTVGADDSAEEGDTLDASMSFDVALLAPIGENGLAYALFEVGSGEGIGGEGELGTLSGFNDDADDDDSVRLTEMWYQHQFGEQVWARLGKVDLTTDFDTNAYANDPTTQFLSSGFLNSLAIEFPEDNGFGGMVWWSPSDQWSLGLGVADTDADWENVGDDLFAMLELDYHTNLGGREGTYRVYAWHNSSDHERFSSGSTDETGYGFGLNLDQALTDTLGAWLRVGWADESVYQVNVAWSTGLDLSGAAFGRDADHVGVAVGMAHLGGDYKAANPDEIANLGDELHVEAYYNWAVNEHLSISPNIQVVNNAGGDADHDAVLVLGVRTQLTF